ncbi:ATP-binding protein [Kitasatospora sp. NPDC005748]|uniref:ATP-binding protein n=1 Tax=Kitasatospora sp. NPDC005748 TaxID=3157063 RepID=UPI0033F743F9
MISSGDLRRDAASQGRVAGTVAFEEALPRHRRSAGTARGHLRAFLAQVPGGAAFADDGQLVVTELVSNAVVHARVSPGREIVVRFEIVCGHLRIAVHDASCDKPVIRRSIDSSDCSGRGLCLVEMLSLEWGCEPRPGGIGKIVWALVSLGGGT